MVCCQLDMVTEAQSSAARPIDHSSRRVVSPLKGLGRSPLKALRRGSSSSDTSPQPQQPQQSPPGERNGKPVRVSVRLILWCNIRVFKRLAFLTTSRCCFIGYFVHFRLLLALYEVSLLNVGYIACQLSVQNYFCQSFIVFPPTLIVVGKRM